MMIILNSLRESFKQIGRHRLIFAIIIILQAFSLALLFFINYEPQLNIAFSLNEMTNYMNAIQLDDTALNAGLIGQADILGPNPDVIAGNFKKIIENLKLVFIYSSIALVLFESFAWALSFRIAGSKFSLMLLFKEIASFAVFCIIAGAVFWSFINSFTSISLSEYQNLGSFGLSLLIILLIWYFVVIAAAMPVKKPKEFFKKLCYISFRKAHIILASYLLIILSCIALISIISYFESILILIVGAVGLLFLGAFARIFLIKMMHRLAE